MIWGPGGSVRYTLFAPRFMLADPPGREQRFYSDFTPNMKHGDDAILKAQRRLATHREQPVGVAYLARQSGLEPRTFLRRFTQATGIKPSEYQSSYKSRAHAKYLISPAPASMRSRRGLGITMSRHFAVSSERSAGLRHPIIVGASRG